jgi:DnaJ-class molecular chaperone
MTTTDRIDQMECPECLGAGHDGDRQCPTCDGRGRLVRGEPQAIVASLALNQGE